MTDKPDDNKGLGAIAGRFAPVTAPPASGAASASPAFGRVSAIAALRGPWSFGRTGPEQRMILDADERYVCSVQIQQCGGGIIAASMEPQRLARAVAILALPDLVAALAALVDQDMAYSGEYITIPCRDHSDALERVRKARAALTKARGE
jgi:hypothetical protein